MDYTKLPTDNLYKFLAIAGVAALIVSVAIPAQQLHEIRLQESRLEGQKTRLAYEYALAKAEIRSAQAEVNRLKTEVEGLKSGSDSPQEKLKRLNILQGQIQTLEIGDLAKNTDQMQDANLDQIEKAEELTHLRAYADTLVRWVCVSAAAGAVVATVGFLLWYFRLQRHQDRIAREASGDDS